MTSFSLNTPDTSQPLPIHAAPLTPIPRPLRKPWSYGRGYTVIALLAPVVLASLMLVYLHNGVKTQIGLVRLRGWR